MRLHTFLVRYAASLALRRPAPDPILSSGKLLDARNCYIVHLCPQDEVRLALIKGTNPHGLSGLWFNVDRKPGEYGLEVSIPNSSIPEFTLSIMHYLNETSRLYKNPFKFIVFQWLLVPYILLYLGRAQQYLFNKRKLARDDRIVVLRHIYLKSLQDNDYVTTAVGLASEVFGYRWLYHPEKKLIQNNYELILKSLTESSDLTRPDYVFRLAPKALITLAAHEEEDRRHGDNVKQQRLIVSLTAAIVFVELLQLFCS